MTDDGDFKLEPEYAHVFHMSTEIEIRITTAAEVVLWSKRDDRPLLAMGPMAAETMVLKVLEVWPTTAELMVVKSKGYHAGLNDKAAEDKKRKKK